MFLCPRSGMAWLCFILRYVNLMLMGADANYVGKPQFAQMKRFTQEVLKEWGSLIFEGWGSSHVLM